MIMGAPPAIPISAASSPSPQQEVIQQIQQQLEEDLRPPGLSVSNVLMDPALSPLVRR